MISSITDPDSDSAGSDALCGLCQADGQMDTLLHKLTRGNALFLILILGFGVSFQAGYQVSGLSSPSPFIQRFINSSWYDRYKEVPPPETVTMIWSLIVSMFAVGGLCGAASIKYIAGVLGKKKALICTSCITIVAALFMLTSKLANSFEMIIVGRILFGYTAGLGSSLHLTYLTEISPKNIRGRITLTLANFVALGKLSGQLLGLSELLGREELWNVALSVPACLSLVTVLVLPHFPESPRYLYIEKEDEEACRKALQNLWGPGDYKQEMDEMLAEQAAIKVAPPKSPMQLLRGGTVRWQLVSCILLYWFNQLSGMSAISTFSFDIFKESGIPEDKIRYVTLGLGVCETITSMSSSFLIERVGRRLLFWGGYGAMSTLWVLVTVMLNLKGSNDWVSYLAATMIVFIIVSFAGGPGSATPPVVSELFIQSDRLAALVIVGMVRWVAVGTLGFAFPFLIRSLGSYSFVVFACVCLLACLYTFFILPETKGKTLLEISKEFKAITMCRKSSPQAALMETQL